MVSVYALLCTATLLRSEWPDADSELACLRDSMMTLAGLAIRPENGEYWKIVCAHSGDLPIAEAHQPDLSLVLRRP
jgi:hypothetical protein